MFVKARSRHVGLHLSILQSTSLLLAPQDVNLVFAFVLLSSGGLDCV